MKYISIAFFLIFTLPHGLHAAEKSTLRTQSILLAKSKSKEEPTEFKDPFASGTNKEKNQPKINIPDPLKPINKPIFTINDKAYTTVGEPIVRSYKSVAPPVVRESIRNFFVNLDEPTHFVNSLLQAHPKDAGISLARLGVNSTIGIGGIFNPAGMYYEVRDRSLNQTLGKWGAGSGFYIVWPISGPTSVRGTVGSAGDGYMDPVNYVDDFEVVAALNLIEMTNKASYRLEQYKDLKQYSVSPYAAVKDVYEQQMHQKLNE